MTELKNNRRTDERGWLVGCDHTGGTLLLKGGTWTGTTEGDEGARQLYCFECGDVFEVMRRNVETTKAGNIYDEHSWFGEKYSDDHAEENHD